MHDKPSDEMKSGPDGPVDRRDAVSSVDSMAGLPELVDELAAIDPAAAPDVADKIAAMLEEGLGPASSTTMADDGQNPGAAAVDQ